MIHPHMSVICIIPARYNSSRFPGKLLAEARGKTVLQRTFESAAKCKRLDGLYVATDDERICDHIQKIGGEVLWTSSAPRDGTERIIEAIKLHHQLDRADIILNLQGDAPCTSPETMNAVIEALRSDPLAAMSTAAAPLRDQTEFFSPQAVKCVLDRSGNALYFSRAPIPYSAAIPSALLHIGLYCYRKSLLDTLTALPVTPLQEAENLEQLKILEWGYRIKVAVVEEKTPSVDTPDDLVKLEEYLCRQNQ